MWGRSEALVKSDQVTHFPFCYLGLMFCYLAVLLHKNQHVFSKTMYDNAQQWYIDALPNATWYATYQGCNRDHSSP